MTRISRPATREIIEDFAKEVRNRRLDTVKPSTWVINFRTDLQDGIERKVYRVPIEVLRFRKDNGRISSDVLDYEYRYGVLREDTQETQRILSEFLYQKDPEKTNALSRSIVHGGQREPAIVTCDGFLINGNRRRMVLERLHGEHPETEQFAYMACVILPGAEDEGGPPTLKEIEKLENRYQLQSDGKSEYYGFDRALSIKRKIDLGLSLEEQLRDDPRYAKADKKEIERAIKQAETDYLEPLKCVDRYLRQFGREGQYRTVSTGMSDHEGRWQALADYSRMHSRYLANPKRRLEYGIDETEVGTIEESAFDIIRLRTIPDMPKVHVIMRDLPKYCKTAGGKKEIMKIASEVDPLLPEGELYDDQGEPLDVATVEAKWQSRNKEAIIHRVKKASKVHESNRERETPMQLLDAAYKKLTHDDMDIASIAATDLKDARELASSIKVRADEIESEVFHLIKAKKKLLGE
ncbi:MAG: hypothetical protein CMJ58_28650 [Planctomycetaceae bacterium]|nr:hypothetical protein [Planctomycetaceae bacterium]